jgi:hypothetical protein
MLYFFASISRKQITDDRSPARKNLEDLTLLRQPAVLALQPPQLLPLVRGQALDAAGADIALPAPVARRLLRHAQLSSDLLERRPGPNERHRLSTELRWRRRSVPGIRTSFLPERCAPSAQVSTKPGQLPERISRGAVPCGVARSSQG